MSEPASQTASTAASKLQGVRKKLGPAWEHCVELEVEVNGTKNVYIVCLYCGHTLKGGGIHRMKQHLAGQKGDAKRCPSVPHDVRFRLQENLKSIHERKQQDQRENERLMQVGVLLLVTLLPEPLTVLNHQLRRHWKVKMLCIKLIWLLLGSSLILVSP